MAKSYNQKTLTAAGTSGAIPIDLATFRNGVGLLVTFDANVGGNCEVQVCGDDPAIGLTHWNQHEVLNGLTSSMNGNLAYPVSAVRLVAASLSGSQGGSGITLAVVQVSG